MNFKYYDLLSSLVSGIIVCISVIYVFNLDIQLDTVPLLAVAYVIGYFINAISALSEKILNCFMGGMPSEVLLSPKEDCIYTGYKRIKFYQSALAIKLLKEELNDDNASPDKMFGKAMGYSNGDNATRVPDFNAQYAFSRVMVITIFILMIIWAFKYYCNCCYWGIVACTLFLAFNRCKERGYYYAREVLTEYIHKKESKTK